MTSYHCSVVGVYWKYSVKYIQLLTAPISDNFPWQYVIISCAYLIKSEIRITHLFSNWDWFPVILLISLFFIYLKTISW